jgi:hypothetical protein
MKMASLKRGMLKKNPINKAKFNRKVLSVELMYILEKDNNMGSLEARDLILISF